MSQSPAVFPACTTCGKLDPRAEIVECAKFTCKTPRGASPPCTPCLNLNKLEDQIAQAEAFLDHLKSHRQRLHSDVNSVHDPFINQIPLEVASQICIFSLEDESSVGSMIEVNGRIPFVLGAVCRRWRDVALSTPVLWTSLVLKLYRDPEPLEYEQTLTTVLERSGQYPLGFYLQHYADDTPRCRSLCRNVISILNQHSHRWRAIDIEIPVRSISELRGNGSSTSILEQLRIRPDTLDNHGDRINPKFCLQNALPSPQSVTISAMRFKLVSINWSNVVKVVIQDLHVNECLQLIQDAPQLRDCTLYNIDDSESEDGEFHIPFPETRIKHASVTNLEIEFPDHVLPRHFLDCVSFPSLKSLVIRFHSHSLDAVTSCIRHCSPPLTHLHITDYDNALNHSAELSRLLWSVPTITHLMFSRFPLTDTFFQHFRTPVCANPGPNEQQFLPCLINFKLNCADGYCEAVLFSWRRLSGSLLSRFGNSDGFQWPLRTFDIVVTPNLSNYGYILSEEAVTEFEELMEYGVDVQLRNCKNEGAEDMIAYSKAYHQSRKAKMELS